MRNHITVLLLCLFLIFQVHIAHAAFGIKKVRGADNSLVVAHQASFTNDLYYTHPPADSTHHAPAIKAKHNNGLQGRLALTFSLLGLIFQPLGAVAMYFGARGWKKGTHRRGLAIAGFILGTIEVLITLLILIVILE